MVFYINAYLHKAPQVSFDNANYNIYIT